MQTRFSRILSSFLIALFAFSLVAGSAFNTRGQTVPTKEEQKKRKEEEKQAKKQAEERRRDAAQRAKEDAKNPGAGSVSKSTNGPANAPAAGPADGLDVAILMKNAEGVFAPVDPRREFISGEQFRVEYNSRINGLVYFINVDPQGQCTVIYRDQVSAGQHYVHPRPDTKEVIEFRGNPGTEVLKLVMSLSEIREFEIALRENRGKLGVSKQQAKDELVGYVAPKPVAGGACSVGIELTTGSSGGKCRSLEIASEQPTQGRISVNVAAEGSAPARLNPGEIAALELRLKHVSR